MRRAARSSALLLALSSASLGCGDAGVDESATQASSDATSGVASTGEDATSETATTGASAGWAVSLSLGPPDGALLSVWGRTSADVYAVGGQPAFGDDDGFGRAFHFDGEAWEPVLVPDATPRLNWVHGTATRVWTVGERGVILSRAPEDADWSAESSGTTQTLWGVWGPSDDELWAVGGDGVSGVPTLLRRQAGAWADDALPAIEGDSKGLFKVWGSGVDDIHVVGDLGVQLHRDGETWTQQANESIADLISVWGHGAGDAIAVGGRSSARLSRWDGAGWTGMTLTGEPGLSGVWVDADGVATVVGAQGTIWRLAPGGFSPEPEDSPTMHFLHAVTGFADGVRVAVGGSLLGPPPHVGVALVYTPG
ncbi:MAG: hypothetical protein KC468_23965 [Myxococcales bacterium]|nr:hypothetical protein [Myxococcales bacterium]